MPATTAPLLSVLLEAIGYEPDDTAWLAALSGDGSNWYNLPVQASLVDSAVAGLTAAGQNVYFMVNRSAHISGTRRGGVQAITQAMALIADIDVKPGGMPDWESAGKLVDVLSGILGCDPVAIVNSGHGLQPYWALDDEQVDTDNRTEVMGLLERWGTLVRMQAQMLGGNADSVFDLPRVLRAPGGVNFKAEPIPVQLHVTGALQPYTLRQLADVLEIWDVPAPSVVNIDEKVAALSAWPQAVDECLWFERRLQEHSVAKPAARHPWMLGAAIEFVAAARNGCMTVPAATEAINKIGEHFAALLAQGENPRALGAREVSGMIGYAIRFVEALSDEQVREQVGHHVHLLPGDTSPFGPGSGSPATAPDGTVATPSTPAEDDLFAYAAKVDPTGDAGLAYAVTTALQGRYLVTPQGNALKWSGVHWQEDTLGEFEADYQLAVSHYARRLYSTRSASAKDIAKMNSMAGTGGEKLLRRWNRLVVDPMKLNSVAEDLCTPAGVVDLRTGILRDADPATDLNTQITKYAPDSRTPEQWLAFLKRVIVDDERIAYLQRLLGSALVGDQRWPDLPVCVGRGANGKSVLLNILGQVTGTYSKVLPENFLVATGTSSHPTELADLRGVRIATLSEVSPHAHFDESRTKALTGGDPVRARKMRQDFEEFLPTWTILIALNTLLQIRSGGDSLFRRIRVVTFDVQIPPSEQNPTFAADLMRAEGGRILSWLIEGARMALESGITPPRRVTDDTLAYRYEEDHLSNFATENLVPEPGAKLPRHELMGAYTRWCRANVVEPLSGPVLFRELPQKITLDRGSDRAHIMGWKLAETALQRAGLFIQPSYDPNSFDPAAAAANDESSE